MFKEEVLQDIKGVAGFPAFALLIIAAFLLGEVKLSAELLIGIILAFGLTALIRTFYFRKRPDSQSFKSYSQRIDASSFPSLHAMRAAVLATIFSIFFGNVILTALLALFAVAVAFSRVMTKRHYVSDVVAGLIFGVIIGALSIWLAARFIS